MGGVLTHLSFAFAGFLFFYFVFKNYKYGLGFVFGSVVPDMIDFGTLGLIMGSVNPSEIMTHPWFGFFAHLGHTWWHWLIFGLMVYVLLFVLFKMKKISKKRFVLFVGILLAFLAGVGAHLIIDQLFIETSYWI